ncbi:hypothetical protein TNCV_2651351 [Trichonephila clavipes]|nr:hypothetical protein TNCV_2651351 [Trichonephila clavipes]
MEKEKREVPLRTAYSQAGRCGMQPKPSSLRAQAQLSETRTETVETFELVKVEQKLLREEKGERESPIPSDPHNVTCIRRTFVWREQGARYLSSNVREIDHYDSGGFMVCSGITLDDRTQLHVFERAL